MTKRNRWDNPAEDVFTKHMGTLSLKVHEDRHGKWKWEIRRTGTGTYMDTSDADERTASSEQARKVAHDRAIALLDESRADLRGLEQFAEEPDRHLTEFFAGRKTEMERLRRTEAHRRHAHARGWRDDADHRSSGGRQDRADGQGRQ